MEKTILSLESVTSIFNECFRVGNNLETGGVLIGRKTHNGIITDTIPSSAYAERTSYSYCQDKRDVKILNHKLREFQKNGYDFAGYWHQHPANMPNLSQIDITTCYEILTSNSYKIDNHLIMCIVTTCRNHNDLPIFSYNVSLDNDGKVVVKQASIKVLLKKCIDGCMEFFEEPSTDEGSSYESYDSKQDSKRAEKPETSDSLRDSGETDSNRQFSGEKRLA